MKGKRGFSLTGLAAIVMMAALLLATGPTGAQSGAPTVVSYQGQVAVSGIPYTGAGYFKFAVVNAAGDTTYWSNDGTSSGGSEPAVAVQLAVSNGLFSVLLGDTALANMTALPAAAFADTDRALRVWFSSDGSSFTLLSPDRRIAAVPYALQAEEARLAGDADTVDGYHATDLLAAGGGWSLAGNAGTDPSTNFLGTTDTQPLVLRTGGAERLRLEAGGNVRVQGGSGLLARGLTTLHLFRPESVAIAGHYAYVVSMYSQHLVIFDISNPTNIVPRGYTSTNLDYPGWVTVVGRYAYVTSSNNYGLSIFDVSNPDDIVARGHTTTNLDGPRQVAVTGRYAYVVSVSNDTLAVFDVSNPDAPVALGSTSTNLNRPQSLALSGQYAYVVSAGNHTLAVFDVSNPNNLVALGTTTTNLNVPISVAVSGGQGGRYAYVASLQNDTLAVFDVSNPNNLVALGTTTTNLNRPISVAISGGPGSRYAYVASRDNDTLAVFDVSDPNNILAIDTIGSNLDSPNWVAVAGRYVCVTSMLNNTLAVFERDYLEAPVVDASSLQTGRLDVGESATVGSDLNVLGSLNVGQSALFGGGVSVGDLSIAGNTAWHNGNDGPASGLDADLLDGQHGGYYQDAGNINAGTLGTDYYSAYADLTAEGILDNNADTDLLTRTQADGRYVNEGQDDSISTGMIQDDSISAGMIQDGATLAEILDDDGAGSTLDADMLDGLHADDFAAGTHLHADLHASTGLSGGTYNGGTETSFSVVYGTAAGSAVQGNQTASITAGNGLTGGVSGDALGDGFAATLNVAGGNGITANADNLNLGPLTANWNQTGAYDVVLDNAASELQVLESTGGTYYGTLDVGDLSGNQTYAFSGASGTVWTSGNDGASSTLDADLLDGQHASAFALAGHNHDTVYWMQGGNSFGAVGRLGTNDNNALELEANNSRILRLEPNATSPNLIGGYSGNWVIAGTLGAVIGGGGESGSPNRVTDHYGVVGGGQNNQAGDNAGSVGTMTFATVGGGMNNTASGYVSAVGGGNSNTASGSNATVPGGLSNTAAGSYSFAAGRRAKANLDGCFVWGDSTDADVACTVANQFVARATGGVSFNTGSNAFQINGSTAWHAGNDGAGSGLDADLLDGQHASAFALAGHNHDAAYVNEGQADSITSAMIVNGTLAFADVGQNGCADGQVMQWNGTAWACASGAGSSWSLTGNAGTDPATNFLGTTDNAALEVRVNNSRILRLEPNATSPNLIGGYSGNWVTAGTLGAVIGGGGQSGALNRVVDHLGTVGGGQNNQAGSDNGNLGDNTFATVGGGEGNTASGTWATIGGGKYNTASSYISTVGGGNGNAASGYYSTVAGGFGNTAGGDYGIIGGGRSNLVNAAYTFVGGGWGNTASGQYTTVAGGQTNTASAQYVTIPGGRLNNVSSDYGAVGGGGWNNVSNTYGTVAGGAYNTASGSQSAVGGGTGNTASGVNATVPGGLQAAATHYGEMAYASGEFGTPGDAQASLYVLRRELTMNAGAWHDLFLDGSGISQRITIAPGRTVTFDILFSGRTEAGESAGYRVQGVIENVGGTTALVGTPTITVLGEDDPAWDVRVIAGDANDTLLPQVQGNGEAIRWVATVNTAEVSW